VIAIREEAPDDAGEVRRVNERAFEQPLEADLVDRLRVSCRDALSLVAVEPAVVGHILFTPVVVEAGDRTVTGMGLAPMAVLPERQRHGIGSRMVREGLARLRARDCPFVFVIGHPAYYPRFGFEPASRHGLRCQWDGISDEAVMVLVLDPAAMAGVAGIARYRPEFDALS
jgi:putative acetyltransferase